MESRHPLSKVFCVKKASNIHVDGPLDRTSSMRRRLRPSPSSSNDITTARLGRVSLSISLSYKDLGGDVARLAPSTTTASPINPPSHRKNLPAPLNNFAVSSPERNTNPKRLLSPG